MTDLPTLSLQASGVFEEERARALEKGRASNHLP